MNDSISSLEILNPVIYCIKMESSKSVTLVWLDRFSNPLSQYTQHVVTLIYRAPELLLNPQEDVRYPPSRKILYDSKVDMWSAG